MLQETHDSKCHCCLIVKYLSQLHKQFIPPIPLVQFNWYCERGGDNDEALTWGRGGGGLNKTLVSQRCLQMFFIFLSRALRSFSRASFARELADVFEKNEKENDDRKLECTYTVQKW